MNLNITTERLAFPILQFRSEVDLQTPTFLRKCWYTGFNKWENVRCPDLQNNIFRKCVHISYVCWSMFGIIQGARGPYLVTSLEVPKIFQKVLQYVRLPDIFQYFLEHFWNSIFSPNLDLSTPFYQPNTLKSIRTHYRFAFFKCWHCAFLFSIAPPR